MMDEQSGIYSSALTDNEEEGIQVVVESPLPSTEVLDAASEGPSLYSGIYTTYDPKTMVFQDYVTSNGRNDDVQGQEEEEKTVPSAVDHDDCTITRTTRSLEEATEEGGTRGLYLDLHHDGNSTMVSSLGSGGEFSAFPWSRKSKSVQPILPSWTEAVPSGQASTASEEVSVYIESPSTVASVYGSTYANITRILQNRMSSDLLNESYPTSSGHRDEIQMETINTGDGDDSTQSLPDEESDEESGLSSTGSTITDEEQTPAEENKDQWRSSMTSSESSLDTVPGKQRERGENAAAPPPPERSSGQMTKVYYSVCAIVCCLLVLFTIGGVLGGILVVEINSVEDDPSPTPSAGDNIFSPTLSTVMTPPEYEVVLTTPTTSATTAATTTNNVATTTATEQAEHTVGTPSPESDSSQTETTEMACEDDESFALLFNDVKIDCTWLANQSKKQRKDWCAPNGQFRSACRLSCDNCE